MYACMFNTKCFSMAIPVLNPAHLSKKCENVLRLYFYFLFGYTYFIFNTYLIISCTSYFYQAPALHSLLILYAHNTHTRFHILQKSFRIPYFAKIFYALSSKLYSFGDRMFVCLIMRPRVYKVAPPPPGGDRIKW